jgi:hypothetical protein
VEHPVQPDPTTARHDVDDLLALGMEMGRPDRDVLDHHLSNRRCPLACDLKRVCGRPPGKLAIPKLIRADDGHRPPLLIFRID